MNRPRILIVTRNMPPLVGGMERLNWHIADSLSHFADVRVVSPEGSSALQPERVAITEVPLRPLWRFLLGSGWTSLRIAHQWKPHIVLAGSGLTAPAVIMAARAANARACVYLHGLDAAVQHPVYRMLWHPAIRRMNTVIANSQATATLAQTLGVEAKRLQIVHPGVQMPDIPQSNSALHAFRELHKLGSARLLLSVGRLTERKGLREFVQNSLPAIVRSVPGILFVIVGDTPTDALLAGVQTRASIQAVADAAGVGSHLRFLGVITDQQQLACAYESASVHVFPVRELDGDPEGFGMVAIEAAAHGLPTVAFSTGGITEAVQTDKSGYLVRPHDYTRLTQAILQVLAGNPELWALKATDFAKQFAWPHLEKKIYTALYPSQQ